MDKSKKFIVNQEIISAVLDNEVCLFDDKKAEYLNLNETASILWDYLKEAKTFNQIIDFCKKNYIVNDVELNDDIRKFLKKAVSVQILLEEK